MYKLIKRGAPTGAPNKYCEKRVKAQENQGCRACFEDMAQLAGGASRAACGPTWWLLSRLVFIRHDIIVTECRIINWHIVLILCRRNRDIGYDDIIYMIKIQSKLKIACTSVLKVTILNRNNIHVKKPCCIKYEVAVIKTVLSNIPGTKVWLHISQKWNQAIVTFKYRSIGYWIKIQFSYFYLKIFPHLS